MKMPSSPNDSYSELLESEDANDVLQGQGYRLIDLERFSSTLTSIRSSFFESDIDRLISVSRSKLASSDQKAQMKKGILKEKDIS